MSRIEWYGKPELRNPLVIVGMAGWSDAAFGASEAARYLVTHGTNPQLVAQIKGEEFFDFTQVRPEIHIADGVNERLTWPATLIHTVSFPGGDAVIVEGPEPQFRWTAFTDSLVDLFHEVESEQVITLGAFSSGIAHTLPVPLMAVASDPQVLNDYQLLTADYHGPTGIAGVLNNACGKAGFETLGLWAAVSQYLSASRHPRSSLALLEAVNELTDLGIDLQDLRDEAIEFHVRIEAAMAASSEFAAYVHELEDHTDDLIMDRTAGEVLLGEIESYLRDPNQ